MKGCLSLCLTVAMSVQAGVSTVPLFLWSSQKHFSGSRCSDWEVPQVLSVQDLSSSVSFLAQGASPVTPLSKFMSKTAENPEAVIALVYHSLCTAEAAQTSGAYSSTKQAAPLSFLKDVLSQSESCVAAPYMTTTQNLVSQELSQAVAAGKGQVVALEVSDKHDCHDVLAALAEHHHLFANGATDMFIVKSARPGKASTKCFEQVLEHVSEATQNWVSLVTADSASHEVTTSFDSEKRRLLESPVTFDFNEVHTADNLSQNLAADPIDIDNVKQYTEIVFALFIGFFMILFLIVGVSCLMSVETPMRFPTKNLGISKEY